MIRDPVVVRSPQATAMKCHDAREGLSALRGGGTSLTEWALVEAHLRQCAECRQEEARLQQVIAARRVTPPRALLDSLGKAMGVTLMVRLRPMPTPARKPAPRASARVILAIGRGIRESLGLIARLRAVVAAALGLTARAIIGAIHAIGHGITRFVVWIRRLSASLAIRFRSSVQGAANVIAAIRLGITHSAKRVAQLRSLPAIPLKPSVRAVGVVLVLAFVLYTLQWTPQPRQHVRSTAAPGPRLEPTQVVSFLPLPPVAPSVEPNSAAPAAPRIDGPRQSPTPIPERVAPVTHVVGRLAAKDRSAAERDFTALLAGVGGTELGRHHRVTFTAVEVVVPQSRYGEFARGLARLGSWQLEAARAPLPDAVHMTIRVSE